MALFVAGATCGRCQLVVAPRPIVPGAVGDMGPLGMACHGFGSCRGVPIPIRCQKFDLRLELLRLWRMEAVRAPCWACAPV
jgi:hypothetical protein